MNIEKLQLFTNLVKASTRKGQRTMNILQAVEVIKRRFAETDGKVEILSATVVISRQRQPMKVSTLIMDMRRQMADAAAGEEH